MAAKNIPASVIQGNFVGNGNDRTYQKREGLVSDIGHDQ